MEDTKNPIYKRVMAQEILLYEEVPNAYNMYVAMILRKLFHINDYRETDSEFMLYYSKYLLKKNFSSNRIDYSLTKRDILKMGREGKI